MKSLFDTATRTGQPVAASSSRRRVSSSDCSVFLPKSCVGSIRIPSGRTPASTARSASAVVVRITSATTSSYAIRCGSVRGESPPTWLQTSPAPDSAAAYTRSGSAPAQVSLSRSAPASATRRATPLRYVSTLITSDGWRARIPATKSTVRRSSSSSLTGSPYPAFTPPISTRSAPSATALSMASYAASVAYVAPRSKNESGVRLTIAIRANSPGPNDRLPSRSTPSRSPVTPPTVTGAAGHMSYQVPRSPHIL